MSHRRSRSREYLGKSVVNGVPQFFSVSALEMFDPRSGGCPRKWFYRYVVGIKDVEDDKPSVQAGHALHDELATYLHTGVKMLSALAISGLHIVPDPGDDLLIEQTIGGPKAPYLTADGVPLVGYIDCAHDRRINKGGDDITQMFDPPHTVEVIDWKWKGDGSKSEFFCQPAELIHTIQMSGYGVFISKAFPWVEHIRLSHGYFPAKRGKPRKVTKLHVIDDAIRSWEYVDSLGRSVRDVARETSPDRVEANVNACGKYGGCPHRAICTAVHRSTSISVFGE